MTEQKQADDGRNDEKAGGMGGRWAVQRGALNLAGQLVGVFAMAVVAVFAFCLIPLGVGIVLFPGTVRVLQAQARRLRRTDYRVTGFTFAVPDLPVQSMPGFTGSAKHCWQLMTDRAFWHLVRWAVIDPFTGTVLAGAPFAIVLWGLYGILALPILYFGFGLLPTDWYAFIPVMSEATVVLAGVLGCLFVVAGAASGPWWIGAQARWSSLLLGSPATGRAAPDDTGADFAPHRVGRPRRDSSRSA